MHRLLTTTAVGLAAATAVLTPATPAQAAGAIVCTLHYGSVSGTSQGSGSCGSVQLTFTAQNDCPNQTVEGAMSAGPGITQFSWTRVGATGVFRTVRGSVGTIAFSSSCPSDGETAVIVAAP